MFFFFYISFQKYRLLYRCEGKAHSQLNKFVNIVELKTPCRLSTYDNHCFHFLTIWYWNLKFISTHLFRLWKLGLLEASIFGHTQTHDESCMLCPLPPRLFPPKKQTNQCLHFHHSSIDTKAQFALLSRHQNSCQWNRSSCWYLAQWVRGCIRIELWLSMCCGRGAWLQSLIRTIILIGYWTICVLPT